MQFLVSSPFLVNQRVVQFIYDMVLLRKLLSSGKASETVITVLGEYFGIFRDISFALIALYFVGRIENVLNGGKNT